MSAGIFGWYGTWGTGSYNVVYGPLPVAGVAVIAAVPPAGSARVMRERPPAGEARPAMRPPAGA